ncbi:MAG: serine/threonine protein kinase [Candidatus Xenobia bacterium]
MNVIAPGRLVGGRFVVEEVGMRGRYSVLYNGRDLLSPGRVLLRHVAPPGDGTQEVWRKAMVQFHREARRLQSMAHPNLPHVRHVIEEQGDCWMVLDPFEGTTAENIVKQLPKRPGERLLVRWMEQTLSVLDYLHAQTPPIIFRDLRPPTLFVTDQGSIRLIDFDLARLVEGQEWTLFHGQGEQAYAAPELFGRQNSQPACDLYSVGATWYELATGVPPPAAIARAQGEPLRPMPQLSAPFASLITDLMELLVDRRPRSAAAALERLRGQSDRTEQPAVPWSAPLLPERRHDFRVPASLSALVVISHQEVMQAALVDFSEHGLRVSGDRELRPGTRQEVTVRGQGRVPTSMTLDTRVVWSRQHEAGLEILGAAPGQVLSFFNHAGTTERRRELRVRHRYNVRYWVPGTVETLGFTLDVSMGALRIATHELLPVRSPLVLRLDLEDNRAPLLVSGHVLRSEAIPGEDWMAVTMRFPDMPATDLERLRQSLAGHTRL